MSKKMKARRLAKRLREIGQHDTAQRLVEAFNLDREFSDSERVDLTPDESLAEIDDEEIVHKVRDLEKFIPAFAMLPDDLEDEQSLVFDTGVFRRVGGK